MAKRKKKTGQEKAEVKVNEKPVKEADKETITLKDERFDFGGLPDRDLKKSLGCG
jgi:ubiquitin